MNTAPGAQDRTYPYLQDRTFRQVVHPAGDPQIGNLATPINSSNLIKSYLQILPAYRSGLTPFRRALEVGLFHGYIAVGPFVALGPLRDTAARLQAGTLSALGLMIISAVSIYLYAYSNPPAPLDHIAAKSPTELKSRKDWQEYARGFLVGSIGGVGLAAFLLWLVGNFS
jgi:photosystem I subunit XI